MKAYGGNNRQSPSTHGPIVPDSFPILRDRCATYMDQHSRDIVQHAYVIAERAHRGVTRKSGEPYIEHPLAVALWLAERQVASDCIAAALLHDVVEDTPMSLQRLRNQFGPVIASLVDGVTKFEVVESPDESDEISRIRERKHRQQAETVRKLLLKMAEDPRVALIKLADRLHNIRTLGAMRSDRQIAIARETLEIYVPLANRLGMAEVKYELQDRALSYIDPDRYEWLKQRIAKAVAAHAERTEATVTALRHVMAQHYIEADVIAREKHLYSVHERTTFTGLDVSELNDLITYRVLVKTRRDCYFALQAIHSRWHQLDARLRDYIGSAKFNGYQALHTTVFGFEGLFDVHIRTHEMQLVADHGPVLLGARQQGGGYSSRSQALAWIEQVRSWQHELSLSATDFMEAVRGDLFQDQIFIFTPKGEVKDLARGATALDLAYRIHTALGDHCIGARVTGDDNTVRQEDRDYVLGSGEIVHILTDEEIHPDASWLHIAKTHHARDAILHYLRSHGLPVEEDDEREVMQSAQSRHVHIAQCCEPWPGDDLVGVPSGHRLAVHRAGCRFVPLPHAHADYHINNSSNGNGHAAKTTDAAQHVAESEEAKRCVHVHWETLRPEHYRASLSIVGQDREGLMHDVAEVMAEEDLNLVRVGAHSIGSRIKATIWVTVDVHRPEQLQRASRRLMGVEGVVSVERRHRLPADKSHHA
jgi:GTP diphosphokinase / guanosine-3',5'-bis(diphosphate) 3'-diphosphatase